MKRVTGIGGIFFKARNHAALSTWYRDRLGIPVEEWGGATFHWRDEADPRRRGTTVWSPFKADTKHFAPSEREFMVNFRVDDVRTLLAQLKAEGCTVVGDVQESEYGVFGWVMDPEGNTIELWQPPASELDKT